MYKEEYIEKILKIMFLMYVVLRHKCLLFIDKSFVK